MIVIILVLALLSVAFPPLLLVTIPLLWWLVSRMRQAKRDRDFYYEEMRIRAAGRVFQ